jgi:glyoxylase-like metal-dependent hydrolase (beta-lactamase superfamily II)
MKRRAAFFVCLAVLSGVAALAQQRDWSKVEIKSEPVRGNIHMLSTNVGGNIGVSVGPDGILIIDDQFLPLADKIRAALAGLSPGKLKFILNTHWHGDHTGGNPAFGPEAPIIAHTNVRERLKTGLASRNTPPAPKEGWPVITFDQSLSVHFNGEEIKVIHFPHGHTDGDSVIFFTGSNVVHMGDDFFSGRFPFVDLDSGGDVEGLTQNVAALIQKIPADAKVIPGHGPISTLEDLKTYHTMMVETTDAVRQKMKAGKPLDEIKKEGVPEKWKSWAWGFINEERWIEIVHRSLSGQKQLRGAIDVPPGATGHGHPHPRRD